LELKQKKLLDKYECIIGIHSEVLGPALGGCRMLVYDDREEQVFDVERLAKGMTDKASLAGLGLGGGKATINAPPNLGNENSNEEERRELFLDFGEFVESFGGRYITAEDFGTNPNDMDTIYEKTHHVVGLPKEPLSRGGSGDPSIITARGVFLAMHACVEEVYDQKTLEGLTVALQGAGHVGRELVYMLLMDDVKTIWVSDTVKRKRNKLRDIIAKFELQTNVDQGHYNSRIRFSLPDKIYNKEADIFSPNARGGSLNSDTIPELAERGCKIVCGAANNQLLDPEEDGKRLMEAGILYGPDYLVNAGGLINVWVEREGRLNGTRYDMNRALERVDHTYHTMKKIIDFSKTEKKPTNEIADRLAEERVMKAAKTK